MSSNLAPAGPRRNGFASRLSKNVAISLVRVVVISLIALVLPAYLTHRLPVTTYGAWVLIIQLGAYVSFLDMGVQTGVAKFVAEFEARGDDSGAGRRASAGFAIMATVGVVGVLLTLALAWQVPRLFHNMPAVLYRDVRISVVLVGVTQSLALVCSVFSAIFIGLQRYTVPMAILIVNRLFFTIAVLAVVHFQGSLAAMGAAVAVVNIFSALLQVGAWRKMASRIRVSFALVDSRVVSEMARYCVLLAIWSVGMVFISGLDVTIVGHYAYDQTASYSIATMPANLVVLIISAILGPLMPASSALNTQRSAAEMGDILARTTRYSTVLLLLTGLPLMVCGYPILRLWVGPAYAHAGLEYLRVLIFATMIRNICLPYATMIAATGKQGAASASVISEAAVNLGCSLYLASRFGAIGVALGTLIGAFISVSMHFVISMHLTRNTLSISRMQLFLKGIFRPAILAVPSLLIFPLWWSSTRLVPSLWVAVLWALGTLFLAWFGSLNGEDRNTLMHLIRRKTTSPSPGRAI